MVQRREGEDIKIPTKVAKVLEEKKDMSIVQENISSMGRIRLMTTRRRWTDNRPFQERKWRKIAHILDKKIIHTLQGQNNRYLVQCEGLEPSENTCVTARDLMNLNPITWKKLEDNNLQELCYFQPEQNDAGTSEGHNF